MEEFLFSAQLPDGRRICVAPVSVDAFEANCVDALGDDAGYFIFEFDERETGAGIEILGKAASYDAAMRLIEIFESVRRRPTIPESSATATECGA